jgi:hypothetical protein
MTDPRQPFHNPATQRERREVLRDTLASRAEADLGIENVGRFAKPFSFVGSEPTAQHPKLPENSPFANDPVPIEEPIDASDCGVTFGAALGEPHEQASSLAQQQLTEEAGVVADASEPARSDPPVQARNSPTLAVASPSAEVVEGEPIASSPVGSPTNYETVEPTLKRLIRRTPQ